MASSVEVDEISKAAAKLASIALTLVFIFFLSYGWNTTLHVVPFFNIYPWASWAAGVAISILAVILAVFVAAERVRISRDRNPSSRYSWVPVFAILFVISAMGSINTLFLFTQGTTLVKETITSTNAKLMALDVLISIKVSAPEFDARKKALEERNAQARTALNFFVTRATADIQSSEQEFEKRKRLAEAAWEQFKAEYTNPLRIGWGADSRNRYDELKIYLPALKKPSGLESVAGKSASLENAKKVLEALAINVAAQMHSTFAAESIRCAISAETAALYERASKLSDALQRLPDAPTCIAFKNFLLTTENTLKKHQEEQGRLLQPSIEEVSAVQFKTEASAQIKKIVEENDKFIQESLDLSFEKARPVLEKAWSNYARFYSSLRQITPVNVQLDLPADIADTSVRNAGNIGNILSILATRLKEPQTYLIFFAALLVDLVLVGVLKRLLETGLGAEPTNPFDTLARR